MSVSGEEVNEQVRAILDKSWPHGLGLEINNGQQLYMLSKVLDKFLQKLVYEFKFSGVRT